MRKLLIAIAAGTLLLATGVSASARVATSSPSTICPQTETQSTNGPEQDKQEVGSVQNVENQKGTQEGQSGNFDGEHQDTGPAASGNDTNDGEKQGKEDDSTSGNQAQQNAPASITAGNSNLQEDNQCGDQATTAAAAQTTKSKGGQSGQSKTGDKENAAGGTGNGDNRDGE